MSDMPRPHLALALLSLAAISCPSRKSTPPSAEPASSSSQASASQAPTAVHSAPTLSASVTAQVPTCPPDMVRVSGNYCPVVQQRCLSRPKVVGGKAKHHCQRYAPSQCLSKKRRLMSFCMDRYEWPNRHGVKPRMLTSWLEALRLCRKRNKRLCTEHEFNFACEGESMKPHVYGFERSAEICNADRPYIERSFNYYPWEKCLSDKTCKQQFTRLDQRLPAGSKARCVSDHGVYDLNGNANEWVFRTDQKSPRRSGLKGGWWGPVRNRCRPMTTFHPEGDYGYEAGFRCCRDTN